MQTVVFRILPVAHSWNKIWFKRIFTFGFWFRIFLSSNHCCALGKYYVSLDLMISRVLWTLTAWKPLQKHICFWGFKLCCWGNYVKSRWLSTLEMWCYTQVSAWPVRSNCVPLPGLLLLWAGLFLKDIELVKRQRLCVWTCVGHVYFKN